MNRTTPFLHVLMNTRKPTKFLEFVDSKHRAAQRAVAACPRLLIFSGHRTQGTPLIFPSSGYATIKQLDCSKKNFAETRANNFSESKGFPDMNFMGHTTHGPHH